jgi:fibronectin type 3 domain-containing protein
MAFVRIAFAAADSSFTTHPENTWLRQSPREGVAAPGFYYEGSGAFDPISNQWIHHAGHDGIPQGFHTFTCDLASGAWTQRFPPTSPPGVCCVDGANVFDLARRCFVRFPGGSLGHGYQWSRGVRLKESAVWLYDPARDVWMNMRPPPYREPEKYSKEAIGGLCSGGVYAANHELAISFGGDGSGGAKNNLHFYDAYANALHVMRASNAPPARDGMGLAYDSAHDRLVMFGSQYLSDERTWFYDFRANAWEARELNPHPPGKKLGTYSTIPRMAYDSINGVVLCLVWLNERDGYETWSLDAEKLEWTKLNPATSPSHSKSRSRNLTFVPEHNVFILELSTTNNRPELWTYRYKKAGQTKRPAAPTNLEVLTDTGKATLTWTTSTGVKENHVYRAEPALPWLADFEKIGATVATTFEDKEVSAGKSYFYFVKAMARDGTESAPSFRARTEPPVVLKPVVSVLATNRIEVNWNAHPAKDIAGYNLYRGVASVKTVKKGEPGAWKDNDPEYAEPLPVKVTDITNMQKLNTALLRATTFTDNVDLTRKEPGPGDYKFAVHAYIVRAVNKLGVESGPSPYAITIPSEPVNFLCRERGDTAELKWDASPEKGIAGYRIYKLKGTWEILPVTSEPLREMTFTHKSGRNATRYWVVAVDALGQEGQPSSPAWANQSYRGFYKGEWHQ